MTEKLAVVVPVYNEPLIARTLSGLYAQTATENVHHFVVDNGSVDDTRAHIDNFSKTHEDFPLTVIEEPQKGTGAAADTGFRQAIDSGYTMIARTDGDCIPAVDWTGRIVEDFMKSEDTQLIGGKNMPLKDASYRRGDELLLPAAVSGARLALAIKNMDMDYLKSVTGGNMATRAKAYESVDGFARTSIDIMDEDVEYSVKIARTFGRSAILIDPLLEVATSMRRIREYGVVGTAMHHLFPNFRSELHEEIDVR